MILVRKQCILAILLSIIGKTMAQVTRALRFKAVNNRKMCIPTPIGAKSRHRFLVNADLRHKIGSGKVVGYS